MNNNATPHVCYAQVSVSQEVLIDAHSPSKAVLSCCICSEMFGVRLTKFDYIQNKFIERWVCEPVIDNEEDIKPFEKEKI